MKPRGSLTATFLTENKTLHEGSADLESPHQANRRGMLPSERVYYSELKKVFEESNFKLFLKRCLWIFVKN